MAGFGYGAMATVSSILLSAGSYLADFVSNVVVAVQYTKRYLQLSSRESHGSAACDAQCRDQTSELAGYFYALVGVLVCCHTLNAIVFKLKFSRKEAPLCAAYFLPLIHLWRLFNLLWRSLSCQGIQDLRSPEMNGLYCILGSALEGIPMLILQFCGYLVLTQVKVFLHSMSTTFKISVAASLISAGYNGGTSVQSVAKNVTSLRQSIAVATIAGVFTLCSSLVRCLTYTNIIVHIREYFSRRRSVRDQARFHTSDTIPLLFLGGTFTVYWLHYTFLHSSKTLKLQRFPDLRRMLTSLSFSYISMMLGPLYPLVSEANDSNELGSFMFQLRLFIVSVLHLMLDITVLVVTYLLGTLPLVYMIVSLVASLGYLLSLILYIKLDAICGPKRCSSMSLMEYRDTETMQGMPTERITSQQAYRGTETMQEMSTEGTALQQKYSDTGTIQETGKIGHQKSYRDSEIIKKCQLHSKHVYSFSF